MTQDIYGRHSAKFELQVEDGRFLIEEGLDLLASFRRIKSEEARKSIITLIALIGEAELEAECRGKSNPER